jgi:hypothetical protein
MLQLLFPQGQSHWYPLDRRLDWPTLYQGMVKICPAAIFRWSLIWPFLGYVHDFEKIKGGF